MADDKDKNEQGPVQIGDLLPKLVSSAKYKKPTPQCKSACCRCRSWNPRT